MQTTFEIPDFIIYKHKDHTNFTIDGIKIKTNSEQSNTADGTVKHISNSIVSLNMNISKVAYQHEYYETNIIVKHCFNNNNNEQIYFHNVYVDKRCLYTF